MDRDTRETMKQEILEHAGRLGPIVGVGSALIIGFMATLIPAVDSVMKSENWYWPLGVIAALGFLLGYQVKVTRQDAMKQKFIAWDDDALRFAHDKVREKRLLGTVANYAIIGVIVLYFLLR